MRSNGSLGLVALVTAGLVLGAGCGSSSGKTTKDQPISTTQGGSATTEPSAGAGTTAGDPSATSAPTPSPDIPKIAEGNWTGRIHVEVTGDKAANFESDGEGTSANGGASMSFAHNEGKLAALAFSADTPAGLSLTVDDFSTAGEFGKDCNITFTKNAAAGVAADFSCANLPAVVTSSTTVYHINVKGNFTMGT